MTYERLAELHFPAKAERLTLVRSLVKRATEVAGCDEKLSEQLVIAINEACMNVIQHAYKSAGEGEVILEILNNNSHIMFRLVDFAEPADIEKIKPRDLDEIRPGGLGVHFINEIMDDCERGHLDGNTGNYLNMTKKIT